MTWSARRRLIIVLILAAVVGFASFYHFSPVIFRAPSCTDGEQNGEETGIDCGGSMCSTLCTFEVKTPTILWARSFAVTDSVYNAAAFIENKNDAATRAIPYEFRLYDERGIFVARVGGTALVPPSGRYAIVETGIAVGTAKVARTTFSWSDTPPLWERVGEAGKLRLLTSDTAFDGTGPVPKLSATLRNPSPTATLENIVVAAILYDANDNAVNVSRTVVPALAPLERTQIVFTWPGALPSEVVRYDLVPIIDVFHAH